jgi:uncharacterized protein (DUF2252 family)
MASDLATTPTTNIRVQACGDCHLLNFGLFATPERNLIFDINDFDETLPTPWEWDVKRLAVSLMVAGRDLQLTDKQAQAAAVECVRAATACLNIATLARTATQSELHHPGQPPSRVCARRPWQMPGLRSPLALPLHLL